MATLIVMPRLSPTMEEGVLAKWLKKEGDKIKPGDLIAEVETDKANMDFPLEDEGTLLKRLVPEGATVKLGAPVGVLGEPGEDYQGLLTAAVEASPKTQTLVAPPKETASAVPSKSMIEGTPPMAPKALAVSSSPGRIPSSPLARKLAEQAGVDLQRVTGTGPGGRIIKRDVEAFSGGLHSPVQASPAPTAQETVLPLSMMRKTIARRLTESKQQVPHFYLTIEAQVEALWTIRQQLNTLLEKSGSKLSINDFVVKAVARALERVPLANASFTEEGIVQHNRVDVGVAVALPEGLLTPVVRQANQKSVGIIASEIKDLAERGRQKKLRPEEYQGATFTVSNLGMYGIQSFSAIINPPESGILAVGQVEKRSVVVEHEDKDTVEIRRCMTLTLSCDHRVVDGALGAQLLAEIKQTLEQPYLLLV